MLTNKGIKVSEGSVLIMIEPANPAKPGGIWREKKYNLTISKDIARWIAREKYMWPGGYALAAVMYDGELLCSRCCWTEYKQIAQSSGQKNDSQWFVDDWTSTEYFESLGLYVCCHCGDTIFEGEDARANTNV